MDNIINIKRIKKDKPKYVCLYSPKAVGEVTIEDKKCGIVIKLYKGKFGIWVDTEHKTFNIHGL